MTNACVGFFHLSTALLESVSNMLFRCLAEGKLYDLNWDR